MSGFHRVGAGSDALVVFGATGDLAHKMIFPALYALVKRWQLRRAPARVPAIRGRRPHPAE